MWTGCAKNLGLKNLRFMRERIRRFTILQFACTDAQKFEKPEKNRKIFQFECAILVKKKKRKRLGAVPEPLFAWRGRKRVGFTLPNRRPFESASRHIYRRWPPTGDETRKRAKRFPGTVSRRDAGK